MPLDVINVHKELPKATRQRHSVLDDTKEWKQLKTVLEQGLKPNEGRRVAMCAKAFPMLSITRREWRSVHPSTAGENET